MHTLSVARSPERRRTSAASGAAHTGLAVTSLGGDGGPDWSDMGSWADEHTEQFSEDSLPSLRPTCVKSVLPRHTYNHNVTETYTRSYSHSGDHGGYTLVKLLK